MQYGDERLAQRSNGIQETRPTARFPGSSDFATSFVPGKNVSRNDDRVSPVPLPVGEPALHPMSGTVGPIAPRSHAIRECPHPDAGRTAQPKPADASSRRPPAEAW